jgi:ZIP family zinc transporter
MVDILPELKPGTVLWAFGLTLFAGLATGIGSIIAFFAKRTNFRFLALSLAFSAGVMLFVSFTEILPKATESLTHHYGTRSAGWLSNAGFFAGIVFMALIDALVPKAENPHELRPDADLERLRDKSFHPHPGLWRMGLFTALAIGIHNFPEGMATFMAALESPSTGIAIAVAVALHNIPEGISVSVPVFYATGDRRRAFLWSFGSGLAEPLGGLVAVFALDTFLPAHAMGMVFAGVAGIMVYVCIDELLPAARTYGKSHEVLAGIVLGMAIMAASLLLLKA